MTAPMLVTLTVPQLRELVREELREALAHHQTPTESDWMTARQASAHAGVCLDTLRAWGRRSSEQGRPVSSTIAGVTRYSRRALDAWMLSEVAPGSGGRKLRAVR